MPQRVREALEAAVAWCERYPDIRSEALRDAIAGAKGIAPADIVCGNGASELFPAILRAVHAKEAACCAVILRIRACSKVRGSRDLLPRAA